MTSNSDAEPQVEKRGKAARRKPPRLSKSDSVVNACVMGPFVTLCCSVAGGLLVAMLFGLFTLDYDGAYRAYEVMLSGVFLIMLPVGIVAGLIAPWILLIVGIELQGAFSKSAALLFAALSGLIVLVQASLEFNKLGCWIGMGLGAAFGIGIAVMWVSDARRGRGRVNPTNSSDSRNES